MNKRCIKRLQGEMKKLTKEPIPNVIVRPDPDNMLAWYYVIYGLTGDKFKECPYEGGVYFGRIDIPNEYPFKPPSYKMHTPSGRFKTDQLLCISISNFHSDQWSPNWTIGTAMLGMITFMQDDNDSGFGSINLSSDIRLKDYPNTSTTEERKKFAAKSLEFNMKSDAEVSTQDSITKKWNQVFMELFPEFTDPDSDVSKLIKGLKVSDKVDEKEPAPTK